MYSDEGERAQLSRAQAGLQLFQQLLPLMAPVGTFTGWTQEEGRTLAELLSAVARSSQSAFLLASQGQL
jgi:hypothetical protein